MCCESKVRGPSITSRPIPRFRCITHHTTACLSFLQALFPSRFRQSRGGAEAGHKRRDSNGSALVSKLSGRPPALSTDFSSLEQMAEEAEKEGGAGTQQDDPARRRQSYFRVGL